VKYTYSQSDDNKSIVKLNEKIMER